MLVRLDEERSDELVTLALGAKISYARTFDKTHPLAKQRYNSHPLSQPHSQCASLISGFAITTPLYNLLSDSTFYNDVFAGLNSFFLLLALPYVLKTTFWNADYTLAFRMVATQVFRAGCGFFTFLPPSKEFLPR